jgi:hypothetical protein
MLIALVSGSTVTKVGDYKELFPNTSFPSSGPDAEFLAQNSAMPVSLFKTHDRATQKLVVCDAYIDGLYVYTVKVESKTAEDLAAETASKSAQVRAQRDALLTACDWTQLPDVNLPKKAEWATYRQALRDITADPAFPDVVLPNNPDYVPPVTEEV